MSRFKLRFFLIILYCLFFGLFFSACISQHSQITGGSDSQVQLRSIQTKTFETTDANKVLRSVVSTLQDLSFVIDKSDVKLGIISATKLSQYTLRITVTVKKKNGKYSERESQCSV